MKGVLSVAEQQPGRRAQQLRRVAHEVVIDMGKVLRVEFGFTSAFFDVIKAIQLAAAGDPHQHQRR
jgi:hypothetical protein